MADDDPQMQPMQGWELKETAERYTLFFATFFLPFSISVGNLFIHIPMFHYLVIAHF